VHTPEFSFEQEIADVRRAVSERGIEAGERRSCHVLPDGEAPRRSHGGCRWDESGLLTDGRMYELVRQHGDVRERTLEISVSHPSAEAYAFTLGLAEMATHLTSPALTFGRG